MSETDRRFFEPFKLDGLWITTTFNMPVFELVPVVGNPDLHKETAEFIVHACNNHFDLLAAAKSGLSEAEDWIHDQLDGTSSLSGALARLEHIRSAIAKADGKS